MKKIIVSQILLIMLCISCHTSQTHQATPPSKILSDDFINALNENYKKVLMQQTFPGMVTLSVSRLLTYLTAAQQVRIDIYPDLITGSGPTGNIILPPDTKNSNIYQLFSDLDYGMVDPVTKTPRYTVLCPEPACSFFNPYATSVIPASDEKQYSDSYAKIISNGGTDAVKALKTITLSKISLSAFCTGTPPTNATISFVPGAKNNAFVLMVIITDNTGHGTADYFDHYFPSAAGNTFCTGSYFDPKTCPFP